MVLRYCLTGMEDIPPGVTAVLTESTTDVLSHVAIRARSQGVLLATCFDEAEWSRLTGMQVGGAVALDGGHVGIMWALYLCSYAARAVAKAWMEQRAMAMGYGLGWSGLLWPVSSRHAHVLRCIHSSAQQVGYLQLPHRSLDIPG